MPMLKTITGHTGCAGVMDYLRKGSKDDRRKRRMGEISEADTLRVAAKGIAGYLHDGHGAEFDRALAEDFVGIPPSAQGDWARYMDATGGRAEGRGRPSPTATTCSRQTPRTASIWTRSGRTRRSGW